MLHVFCNLEDLGDDSDPMCDMTFEIVERQFDEQSSTWKLDLRVDATPYGQVGFDAKIPRVGWTEQIDDLGEEEFRSYWGNITLQSCGEESDELLTLMADYFEISAPIATEHGFFRKILNRSKDSSVPKWTFAESIECQTVCLASDPSAIADKPVRMKLFFENVDKNGRYAEVFLILDMAKGVAYLDEKDEDYRADLIHWLSLF